MTSKILIPEELKQIYETHLKAAFPPSELKPLSSMEAMRRQGIYDPLGFFDDAGELLGVLLLWKHGDGRYILIDYFCVPAEKRGGGIGGKLLTALREHYPPDTVFIGESEAPTGDPAADAIILRRLGFYERSGAVTLGYDSVLFGVHFKTICWADPLPDEEEILRKHQEIYRKRMSPANYERFIQLPLHPGEALKPVTDWVEED